MIKFEVSEREAQMLIAAMSVVQPHGGGSAEFTLECKLRGQMDEQYGLGKTYMDVTETLSMRYATTVVEEWAEVRDIDLKQFGGVQGNG
jgi:hypothetical protein